MKGDTMRDLVEFKTLITPLVMSIVWTLGALGIAFSALVMLFSGATSSALIWFTAGELGWRLFTEAIVVIFAIHDTLRAIERKP